MKPISEEQLEKLRTFLNVLNDNLYPGSYQGRCGYDQEFMFVYDMDIQRKLDLAIELIDEIEYDEN